MGCLCPVGPRTAREEKRRRSGDGPLVPCRPSPLSRVPEPALLFLAAPSRPVSRFLSRPTSLSRVELGHRAGPTVFRAQ